MDLPESEREGALDTLLRTWSVPLATRPRGEQVGPHLYVLGSLERRVTLLAQQIRALNLVSALVERANLPPAGETRIAVVGAGVAGATAALAARRAGFRTHLFERFPDPFPLLRSGQTRWLHPHIYDWPNPGWQEPSANLPILNWEAASAALVCAQLDRQWQAAVEEGVAPEFHGGIKDFALRGYDWEAKQHLVSWEEAGRLANSRFHIVILALGFGEESEIPDVATTSYWQDFGFKITPNKRLSVLVVGDGDGGLIDTLRARFKNFRQEALIELLGFEGHEALAGEVLRLEHELAHNRLRPLDLAHFYDRLPNVAILDRELEKQLRSDTRVTLAGRSPNMMNPNATPLHRLLVHRLLRLKNGGVEFYEADVRRIERQDGQGTYRVEIDTLHGTGMPTSFHEVVVRTGPRSALASSFPQLDQTVRGSYASSLSIRLPPRLWNRRLFGDGGSESSSQGPVSEGALLALIDDLEQKWPDPHAESAGFRMVQRELDLLKRDPTINRAYALDHFDPTIWAAPRAYYWLALQCRRFLKENFVSQPAPPRWDIIFSPELLAAIGRSVRNIGRLPGPRPRGGLGASLTHFDDTPVANRPHRPTAGTPRFEMARILLWRPEWLFLGFVEHLLRMHSAFNVPLFFIDQQWVVERGLSMDIEYLLLCTKDHDRSMDAHDLDGSEWPRNPGEPRSIHLTDLERPLDHFLSLLECDEVLFAVDAYKIVRDGRWEEYVRLVRSHRS